MHHFPIALHPFPKLKTDDSEQVLTLPPNRITLARRGLRAPSGEPSDRAGPFQIAVECAVGAAGKLEGQIRLEPSNTAGLRAKKRPRRMRRVYGHPPTSSCRF